MIPQRPDCHRGAAASIRAAAGREPSAQHRGHPAVSDREYTDEEREVLRAMDAHKLRTGRRFPLVTDYLEVLRALGYRRQPDAATGGGDR
jgi:hypothetical protein